MGQWSNNSEREKTKVRKKMSQCHFIHQNSNTDWPEIEPGPPCQTCSRMTGTVSDMECLPNKDVLTSKLAVNSNQTSHNISTSGMTFCKVWIVVLAKQEKIPARNAGGCTRTKFHSK